MTRINVVRVKILTRQHLVAEYRELPRMYAHSQQYYQREVYRPIPDEYVLGTGHMDFFIPRLGFIIKRHQELIDEMTARGYHASFSVPDRDAIAVPWYYWRNYKPTDAAIELNMQRLKERDPDGY